MKKYDSFQSQFHQTTKELLIQNFYSAKYSRSSGLGFGTGLDMMVGWNFDWNFGRGFKIMFDHDVQSELFYYKVHFNLWIHLILNTYGNVSGVLTSSSDLIFSWTFEWMPFIVTFTLDQINDAL